MQNKNSAKQKWAFLKRQSSKDFKPFKQFHITQAIKMPLNLICDKEASFQKMEMQVSLQVQIRQIPASTSYWSTRRFLWFIIYSQQAGDGERVSLTLDLRQLGMSGKCYGFINEG